MSCINLYMGQDYACKTPYKKYYQQVRLINKDDVLSYVLNGAVTLGDDLKIKNRVRFSLKEGKYGFLFRAPENGTNYFATFSKETEDNIPQYLHNVQVPIFGAEEETKSLLKTLDNGRYFAAIQFMDGTVEIYGFHNGLTTDDYDFDLQGGGGASFINLVSNENGLEDDPPYVYVPLTGSAGEHFDTGFRNIPVVELGDFNDDFNSDFDIT